MGFSRRQLQKLIEEIRQEDISVDEGDAAILKRWRDEERAIDALRDILARAEKAHGIINESDVAAFIRFVLTIKLYAQKTDRRSAEIRPRRELKRLLAQERTLLVKAIRRRGVSYKAREEAIKRMTELDQMNFESQAQPPVRSSKRGSRIRTLFMRELSAAVHEDAGVWMDDQVATIASIVLECDIDSNQVRNTRRR
jgi:hypothetical protein